MNKFMSAVKSFARDEEGAQIVEYALVIAVISVAVLVALKTTINNGMFTGWLTRVTTCLTGGTCA